MNQLIDVWANAPLTQMAERVPEVKQLLERSGTAGAIGQSLAPARLIEQMNEAGFEKMLISAWHRPGGWVVSNDEVAEFIKDYPGRLYGIASVNLEKPVEAVKELERAVTQLGFKALRIVPWLWKLPPNDRLYYPLYVKCIELGIPFCTQIGHTGPLMPSETGRLVPYLDDVMLTFPELVVVGGHMGYPWIDETIGMMLKHRNFYIDTSAHLPKTYPQKILDYLKTWGRKKVLFGTNFPQLDLKKCARQVRALELGDKIERTFFADNARRIFQL